MADGDNFAFAPEDGLDYVIGNLNAQETAIAVQTLIEPAVITHSVHRGVLGHAIAGYEGVRVVVGGEGGGEGDDDE
jgi:hypothetical protein